MQLYSRICFSSSFSKLRSIVQDHFQWNEIFEWNIKIYFSIHIFLLIYLRYMENFSLLFPIFLKILFHPLYISYAVYSESPKWQFRISDPLCPELVNTDLLSPISCRFGTKLRSWSSPTSSVILSSMNSKVTCIQFLSRYRSTTGGTKPFGNYKFKAIYENLVYPRMNGSTSVI